MPGSTPPTSQLDWLSSTTAMIVLSWSKATRDLLKSFSWGIGGTPSVICQRRWCHLLAACPIPSHRRRKIFKPSGPRRGDGGPRSDCARIKTLEHAEGIADREIALLTAGYGMSRVLRPV